MSYEGKILVLTFAGTLVLALAYLYLKDFLYTKTTGRPASQRYRERVARWNRPLTRNRYLALSLFFALITAMFAYLAGWSQEYKGWGRLVPLFFMIDALYVFYVLQKRWRKQQPGSDDQVSGMVRK
jgi:hypothetical protein